MNAENFSEYLKNPSQLYQISYQELKSLVLQYPYSPNLRYLLMRKAKMENNNEYDRLLSLASTYSIDRSFLFKKMKADRLIPEFEENYELNEEYLELKDLAALEVEAELVEVTTTQKPDELAFALDDLVERPENIAPTPAPSIKKEDDLAEDGTGSLLERLLDGEFADMDAAQEHEVLSSLSLADISKAADTSENDAVEEKIIENSLEELAEKSDLIQQFEAGTTEVEILEEVPTAKSDSENIVDAEANFADELAQQFEEEEAKTLSDSDMDVEEEGQIFEQERFPDLELKSLDELMKTDKEATIPPIFEEEFEVSEEPIRQTASASIFKILEESEEIEEEDTTVSLNELSKKSEKPKATPDNYLAPKPLPKSSFNSWLKQYKSPLLDSKIDDIKEKSGKKSKKKKGKKKDNHTRVIAKASVQEDLEIATETLASLLEKQGHYGRAIRMYETLRLRNPEKNAFFAAKIEALQKLRDEE